MNCFITFFWTPANKTLILFWRHNSTTTINSRIPESSIEGTQRIEKIILLHSFKISLTFVINNSDLDIETSDIEPQRLDKELNYDHQRTKVIYMAGPLFFGNQEQIITNKIIDINTPITIATVKSNTTVANIVTKNCVILVFIRFEKNCLISCHSFIFQAVIINTPAKADKGILDINGPKTNIEISKAAA